MKRKGSIAIYLTPWHADIYEFLDLKKNTGKDEMRARDLFYALSINDLFMQRVQADEDWTLMDPHTCPGLQDVYAEEFVKLYESYEKAGKGVKVVKARHLWTAILTSQIETGMPYLLYVDAANKRNNQSHLGVIRNSNLCIEILEYSGKDRDGINHVAVCNLASIALPRFVKKGKFDFEELGRVSYIAAQNLDKVIDKNFYPLEDARISNQMMRPIGLGVQGLQDVYFLLRMPFESEEARILNVKIWETIYYNSVKASCDLAKEKGAYARWDKSEYAKGVLQFDMWDSSPNGFDWAALKEDIKKWGLRNSLITTQMPTASCQVSTTVIQTPTGNKSFRQIMEENSIDWSYYETLSESGWVAFKEPVLVDTRFGQKESTRIWYNGHKETIDIEMEDGSIFKATENHRFLVMRDNLEQWVYCKDLQEGDDIVTIK